MTEMSGLQRITAAFEQVRAEDRAALIPYLTLGYPTPAASLHLAQAAIAGGADLLELGVPFSDPLADGPLIQRASHIALQQGMNVARSLEMAGSLRREGVTIPFIFMGYYNPILAYGEEDFCHACHEVGVDGLIIPDLPPEEGATLAEACDRYGLALICLVAPTSDRGRIRTVCERTRGFVYLAGVVGITGPQKTLAPGLASFVARVRAETDRPLAVGFGISTPEQAGQVAGFADGVIVGSALVRLAEGAHGAEKVRAFVTELRRAVYRTREGG